MLSLFLLAAIAFVAIETYQFWQRGPWELPRAGKAKSPAVAEEPKKMPQQTQLAGTRNIIDKNLFDPERGASRTKEAEASAVAMQRIRSMILLGTAVLGNGRYAILQQPSDPRLPAQKAPPGQQAASMRLKVGDMVEGFRLSEIRDRSVVFTNGSSNLEISVDYFRKGDDGLRKGPAPTAPRPPVSPRFPRPNAPGGEDPGLGRE